MQHVVNVIQFAAGLIASIIIFDRNIIKLRKKMMENGYLCIPFMRVGHWSFIWWHGVRLFGRHTKKYKAFKTIIIVIVLSALSGLHWS